MLFDPKSDFDRKKARAYFEKLLNGDLPFELKATKKQRTIRQNAYLHVCLSMFCAETGYTIDESKELFSLHLPDLMRYTKKEVSFRKSSKDLDSKEMTVLIDKIREMSMDQLGLYIPTSEEYLINKFQIDKEIELMGVG